MTPRRRRPHGTAGMALGLLLALAQPAAADDIRVAAASNFRDTLELLVARFEADSGHRVAVSFASTGKHYAQIRQGAPFDVFLAADAERPRRLADEGEGVAGSRFTYAVGLIAVWGPGTLGPVGPGTLRRGRFDHLAIANPRLAPYGAAARQAMRELGVWETVEDRLVRGENVEQAYQFVASGNAELGIVALPQIDAADGDYWVVPTDLYDPIEQQALLLDDRPAARAFVEFLRSPEARGLIASRGYALP